MANVELTLVASETHPYWIDAILTPIFINAASGILVGIGTLLTGWWLLRRTDLYAKVTSLWQQKFPAYRELNEAAYAIVVALSVEGRDGSSHDDITRLGMEYFQKTQAVKIFCGSELLSAMSTLMDAIISLSGSNASRAEAIFAEKKAMQSAYYQLQQAVRQELKIDLIDGEPAAGISEVSRQLGSKSN